MLITSDDAKQMQEAIDKVFRRLPEFFQTERVRGEIAKQVVWSRGNYEETALTRAIELFDQFTGRMKPTKLQRMRRSSQRRRDLLERERQLGLRPGTDSPKQN